jgi:hypothetical protein
MYFDGSRIDAERRCKSYAYRGMYRSEREREREREIEIGIALILYRNTSYRARSLSEVLCEPLIAP